MKPHHQKELRKLRSNSNTFIRYSGLAFEMLVIIGAGVFGGIKLDALFRTKPLLTALLSLLGVVIAIYFAVKDLLKKT